MDTNNNTKSKNKYFCGLLDIKISKRNINPIISLTFTNSFHIILFMDIKNISVNAKTGQF